MKAWPAFAAVLFSQILTSSVPAKAQFTFASDWNPDSNGDDLVTVVDLMALLSVFEDADSDGDGVWNSLDPCVGVIDACGVCAGNGTDTDLDGICDSLDPCVGNWDACGVCNGPGPNFPVLMDVVSIQDSVFVPPMNQWYVFTVQVDSIFAYVCPIQGCMDSTAANFNPDAVLADSTCLYGDVQCGGLSFLDFAGTTYPLVGIGDQCWFKNNLQTTVYATGDPIPSGLTSTQWAATTAGANASYPNGTSATGRLYNFHAVADPRGLCPTGFHVPTDQEWTALVNQSGGVNTAALALKAAPSGFAGWDGSNSSGFTALPGGYRHYLYGNFWGGGEVGYWWSSSLQGTSAWFYGMGSNDPNVLRSSSPHTAGFSVRCLKN
jgi:uncharacterized protein (TIGR02145 family)